MSDLHDLEISLRSHVPILAIETLEETRAVDILNRLAPKLSVPFLKWTITDGLGQLSGLKLKGSQEKNCTTPTSVLERARQMQFASVYVLLDFHPYLENDVHIRLLKEIAQTYQKTLRKIVLVGHKIEIPPELRNMSARFELSIPGKEELNGIVTDVAEEWLKTQGSEVKSDDYSLEQLANNLTGLSATDAREFARKAIFDDGVVCHNDASEVMKAKYDLMNQNDVLSFEYDTASFSDVAGLKELKRWLEQRKIAFNPEESIGLDPPKGALLVGVQGCGKSLAAKAVAGLFGVPLLRLDFSALYNKFIGETERNLRESLRSAEVLAPCVLWFDEIEKGVAGDSGTDGGTSKRLLGLLLTWMAEKKASVFIVATANDIESLPPELIRKGRFDEIFFVDLPTEETREVIARIHLEKRGFDPAKFDIATITSWTDGFSGAEIEQAIVSGLYSAHAKKVELCTEDLLEEIKRTRPLSVLMAEKISHLRSWAADRTVPAN